ncbi:hypothetical protein Tdes44962_MAKER02000 [Teratosphaeria destructans]|uniref:Uncharacterized protein n=1 Tax=Teratosphaeria destructans TaxID=418781 RepID=A0A9W7W465_9PEZI|nr:hypothetical protein Tdes44962_MAKER02000 [Teratosphaeria destructans]
METDTANILTQALAQVDINQSESPSKPDDCHLLTIEAPAPDLLPTTELEGWESMPYIHLPNDVIRYCPPPQDKSAVGITDTSFWTVFPIQDVKVQPHKNMHLYMHLVQAILELLIYRESYRAYYHTRDALNKHYGPGAAAFEQSQWTRDGRLVKGSTAWNRILSCCYQLKSCWQWTPLQHQPVDRIDGPVTVSNMTILMALDASLRSLTPVPSICPAVLCAASMPHTKLVEHEFANLLYHSDATRTLTPPQLYRHLQGVALHTAIDPDTKLLSVKRLPGWNAFLGQWLQRAVNFIAERRCDDPSHTGLHAHGSWKYYNPMDWTYDAENYVTVANFAREAEAEEAMMRDVADMIGRATLGR